MMIGKPKRYPRLIEAGAGESLSGFVHRLARKNGLASAGWIRADLGLRQNQVDWTDEHFARFAVMSGQPESALRALHHPPGPEPNSVYFKTGLIDKRMLDRMAMRYCPTCLAECGYHQSIWDLRFVTICPFHRIRLIEQCPACHKPLLWVRRKFLECRCGAAIPLGSPEPPEAHVPAEVLDGIRALYEKCGVPHDAEPILHGLPEPIRTLDLDDFCSFLWFVGNTRNNFASYRSRIGLMQKSAPDTHLILRHGFEVATQWPAPFHRWMQSVRQGAPSGQTKGLAKQFKLLESKMRNLRRPAVLALIQEAILAFAVANDLFIHQQQTLLVPPGSAARTRMITIKEAAEILKCAPYTVTSIALAQGWIDAEVRGKRGTKAVPEHLVRQYAETFRPELNMDQVREHLKVGYKTMHALLGAGLIGRPRKTPRHQKGAFHWSVTEKDIDAFNRRIEERIQPLPSGRTARLVPLRAIAARNYIHGLTTADIVRAVLRGDLVPRGRHQSITGLDGLLFDDLESARYYADQGSGTKRCLTPAQAGLLLSLHAHQIVAAIHLGLLEADKTADGRKAWLLSLREVEGLGHTYTTPSLLAVEHRCNPNSIRAALGTAGVNPISSTPGSFAGSCFYPKKLLAPLNLAALLSKRRPDSK